MKYDDDNPRTIYKRRLENLWRDRNHDGGPPPPDSDSPRVAYMRRLGTLWQQKPGKAHDAALGDGIKFRDDVILKRINCADRAAEDVAPTMGAALKRHREERWQTIGGRR